MKTRINMQFDKLFVTNVKAVVASHLICNKKYFIARYKPWLFTPFGLFCLP